MYVRTYSMVHYSLKRNKKHFWALQPKVYSTCSQYQIKIECWLFSVVPNCHRHQYSRRLTWECCNGCHAIWAGMPANQVASSRSREFIDDDDETNKKKFSPCPVRAVARGAASAEKRRSLQTKCLLPWLLLLLLLQVWDVGAEDHTGSHLPRQTSSGTFQSKSLKTSEILERR